MHKLGCPVRTQCGDRREVTHQRRKRDSRSRASQSQPPTCWGILNYDNDFTVFSEDATDRYNLQAASHRLAPVVLPSAKVEGFITRVKLRNASHTRLSINGAWLRGGLHATCPRTSIDLPRGSTRERGNRNFDIDRINVDVNGVSWEGPACFFLPISSPATNVLHLNATLCSSLCFIKPGSRRGSREGKK